MRQLPTKLPHGLRVIAFLVLCVSTLRAAPADPQFPLTLVQKDCQSGTLSGAGTSEIQLSRSENGHVLSAKNRLGKHWRVDFGRFEWGMDACSVWHGDLDKNGIQDLLILQYTGGNGIAPNADLIILLFDRNALPVPWNIDGMFAVNERGIDNLRASGSDGRAELHRISSERDDKGYVYSYESLFRPQDAQWHQIRGEHGGTRYPSSGYVEPTIPGLSKKKPSFFEAMLSNRLPARALHTTLNHFRWANVEFSEDPTLYFGDGRICRPKAWYSTFVTIIDRPNSRDAAFLGAAGQQRRLLTEIVTRKLHVRLAGRRDATHCSPETLWAIDSPGTRP